MPVTTPAASTSAVPRSTQGGTIGAAQVSLGASGSASSHIYNAPSAGSMSGAGGARRPAPDMVVPFTLPSMQQVDAWSRQQQAGKGNKRQKRLHSVDLHRDSQSEEEHSEPDEAEQAPGGTLLSIEQSSTLLQSLRQSRLLHLTSLLPIFSTRQRAGVTYAHPIPLPRNLDPRQPHVLMQLGRADVRVGPHIFARTKFWEVREDETRASSVSPTKGGAPGKALPKTTARPAPPPAPPARQAISPALVLRVNQRAATDAALQQLLHVAASGAASSEQLQILGTWIQGITEELRAEGVVIDDQPPPPPPQAAQGPSRVAPPAAASSSNLNAASSSTSTTATALPSPPILVVEFRENPSARFVLPIWSHACVERTLLQPVSSTTSLTRARETSGEGGVEGVKGEVVLTFTLPAIGAEGTDETSAVSSVGRKSASKAPLTRAPLTWRLGAVSETVWDTFGRCTNARTVDWNGKVVRAAGVESGENAWREVVEEFVKLYRTMPKPTFLAHRVPAALIPAGLEEHLTDRFGARIQTFASRPLAKRKAPQSTSAASAVVVEEDVSFVGSTTAPSQPGGGATKTPKARPSASVVAVGSPAPSTSSTEPKPKRKRHVATHNADGTRKACGACGTLNTPMWRRGPAGPSQLCNACGARWKAGRLVVPDTPPPHKVDEGRKVRRGGAQWGNQNARGAGAAGGTPTPASASGSVSAQSTPVLGSATLGTPRLGTAAQMGQMSNASTPIRSGLGIAPTTSAQPARNGGSVAPSPTPMQALNNAAGTIRPSFPQLPSHHQQQQQQHAAPSFIDPRAVFAPAPPLQPPPPAPAPAPAQHLGPVALSTPGAPSGGAGMGNSDSPAQIDRFLQLDG